MGQGEGGRDQKPKSLDWGRVEQVASPATQATGRKGTGREEKKGRNGKGTGVSEEERDREMEGLWEHGCYGMLCGKGELLHGINGTILVAEIHSSVVRAL